jgi:ERCC4-type nuclease
MARQHTRQHADHAARAATIIVDKSETRSRVPDKLAAYPDLGVESAELAVGDYILSPEVLVERKTVDDLVNSLKFGRLFEQLAWLQLACSRLVLLIQSNLNARRSQIKDEPLRGAAHRLDALAIQRRNRGGSHMDTPTTAARRGTS